MYEYKITDIRVVDGDTIEATVDLGFKCYIRRYIRLYDVDTWETKGPNKIKGKEAKKHLKELLNRFSLVVFISYKDKKGKYGRLLGTLWGQEEGMIEPMWNINAEMKAKYSKENKDVMF